MKTVTNAVRPLLAKRTPRDEEDWVIRSRAQVTKLSTQRRDEGDEANKKKGCDYEGEVPRAEA